MKKLMVIMMILMLTMAVVVQPAMARATACDDFAANVVVGSWHSVLDALECAAEDPTLFFNMIGVF